MEKQGMRDSLIENIASELKKDVPRIDSDFIDRSLDALYALDGLSPPKLSDEALGAAARTVKARAAWRHRNRLERRALKGRFIRRAWAACFAALLLFFINYVTTVVTGYCLPSQVGIKICCGTTYCFCDTSKTEQENPSHHE
ncbi:MAG: hypothetical protein LBU25_02145 [Treponema sp.]|jgi:hypothetical protein|nr:hypothetical protein [Treponema sp.]